LWFQALLISIGTFIIKSESTSTEPLESIVSQDPTGLHQCNENYKPVQRFQQYSITIVYTQMYNYLLLINNMILYSHCVYSEILKYNYSKHQTCLHYYPYSIIIKHYE